MIVLNKRLQAILGDAFVFYYAFFKWGRIQEDKQLSFSYHKKSLYLFIFLALVHEQLLEFIAFHYLLNDRFPDFLVSLLQVIHLYGIIYLIGDYNLVRRGRVKVDDTKILINVGIRKSIEIDRKEVKSVSVIHSEKELIHASSSFWVVATPLFYKQFIGFKDDINCQVILKKAIRSYGFLGISRDITHINLAVDDLEGFVKSIS
ncbi:hypothetical protein Back11_33450 [Paenibacillus baekrokdamisoli]|uniref:Uncharacterized protein n=1 Tax=Paenibacillus baekrokdamisoli TaxID=1712516 RepID=A0A3G9IT02_9BACL|nr:hypothetical protein [Paenibacillus baekrokdamisoli]MBB3072924.1 hypothetical protein [Paenibacillus baekrokdamisoli]BBH22000.1 hypothetical protein Back11_33450 [Paenibacillus baekrokdamisoli]